MAADLKPNRHAKEWALDDTLMAAINLRADLGRGMYHNACQVQAIALDRAIAKFIRASRKAAETIEKQSDGGSPRSVPGLQDAST